MASKTQSPGRKVPVGKCQAVASPPLGGAPRLIRRSREASSMVHAAALLMLAVLPAPGGTREELAAATLRGAPPAQHAAIRFLIEHMPARDVDRLSPEFLRENTALAFKARDAFAWGREIPEDIFLNDVLPYATLTETRDKWRADFLDRFGKLVTGEKTAREAILKLNAAIARETGVNYNVQRRRPIQSPLESMEQKMATCTGLSILLVDALRSVGLPARIAGTARWTTKRGNHTWVEVWLPDTRVWAFTEYASGANGFDRGWLLGDAARGIPGSALHGIYATSWRKTSTHFPLVENFRDTSVPGVDVTRRYLELGKDLVAKDGECELRIDVVDASGKRMPVSVEVRQGDAVVARGESPKPTDDLNCFFAVKVKQGQFYQVLTVGQEQPAAFERLQTQPKEETRRVTLQIGN